VDLWEALLARGGRPRDKAGDRLKAGRRRPGTAVGHALPGVAMRMAYDRDTDPRELMRTDSHKVGVPFRLSATTAVAAVSRDLAHASLWRIAGALGEATGWTCAVTHSQIGRQTSAEPRQRRVARAALWDLHSQRRRGACQGDGQPARQN